MKYVILSYRNNMLVLYFILNKKIYIIFFTIERICSLIKIQSKTKPKNYTENIPSNKGNCSVNNSYNNTTYINTSEYILENCLCSLYLFNIYVLLMK